MHKTGKAFLKQDFISILEWYRKKNLIHPVFEISLSNTIEFYANKYDETFTYLNKVSEKYTFENRENVQLYKEELKPYSRIDEQFIVSLATNIGENDIVILLNKCGAITGMDKELGELKLGNSGIKNNVSNKVFANTEIFPIKYFRKFEGVKSEIERTFYFTFLSYVWQEVNGNKNGSLTSTNENNSCNKFFMNDFSYDDFSVFQEDDCTPKFVNEYFNRKLTIEELFIRAKFTPYPLNPYENNYRYFEKNDEFVELILYTDFVGIRVDKVANFKVAKVNEIKSFAKLREACLFIKKFSDDKINSNWSEKLRPAEININFTENHLEFDYWSGINWYPSDVDQRINYNDIETLEQKNNINLPKAFKTYLHLLNGHKDKNYMPYYSFENEIINVLNFYNFEEITYELSIFKTEYIKIGVIAGGYLTLVIDELSINYSKVGIEKNGKHLVGAQNFEEFIRHSSSVSISEPQYYIFENNIEKLKLYIPEMDKSDKEIVDLAIEYNSHEVLNFLLNEGFDFRHKEYATHFTKIYNSEIVSILNFHFK